jgi:hypothetical protein
VLVPLASATPLIGLTPAIAYPIEFWVVLLAVTLEGRRLQANAQPLGSPAAMAAA